MALNKLKKWIGTQAMTAFFDQLNENVDATNAAIDLVEQMAEYGSNSNGEYWKFPSGLMIVNRFISAIYDWEVAAGQYSLRNFDLPASFINSNYVVSVCGSPFLSGGYPSRGATLSAVGTSTTSVRAFVTTGSYACDQVRSLSLICVGRWK